jgi:hypothetical protein
MGSYLREQGSYVNRLSPPAAAFAENKGKLLRRQCWRNRRNASKSGAARYFRITAPSAALGQKEPNAAEANTRRERY